MHRPDFSRNERTSRFQVGLRVSDGEQLSPAASQLSQHTADLIDKEINRFLNESYNRAKEILTKHKVCFQNIQH